LARKTHHEMITKHLYVAVSDNDHEIAALRTLERKKFTHIVRVKFEPASDRGITPSSWAIEETHRVSRPSELRLTCPALSRRYGHTMTALSQWQLLASRNYIAQMLPAKDNAWVSQGLEFPFSPEECANGRLLIVGPPNRSVDVMAILVCYISFLSATRTDKVLDRLQRLGLVDSPWAGSILGQKSLALVDQVARK
ncbi:hypothetical protein V8E55_005039, partial [Tylopilus felleus]